MISALDIKITEDLPCKLFYIYIYIMKSLLQCIPHALYEISARCKFHKSLGSRLFACLCVIAPLYNLP